MKDGTKGLTEVDLPDIGEVSAGWIYHNEPDVNYVGFEIDYVLCGPDDIKNGLTDNKLDLIATQLMEIEL